MKRILLISTLAVLLSAQAPSPSQMPNKTPSREPLSLQDAIAACLSRQPRVGLAESQVQMAVARQDQTKLEGLGRLDTSFAYTPRQKAMQVFLMGEPFEFRTNETWAFNASLDHPLYTWGAQTKRNQAAQQDVASTQSSRARTRQQLVFDVSQAYAQAALGEESVAVARKAWEQQQGFLRLAQARVKAGSAARLDVLKAELGLAQSQSSMSEATNRARLARESLALLAQDERFRNEPLEPLEEIASEAQNEALTETLTRALGKRWDVESLRQQCESLKFNAQAALASGKPTLSLRASITQQSPINSELFRRDSQQYSLGLALTWEAFGSLRSRARAAELRAQEYQSRETLRNTESTVALEIRQAHASLGESIDRQKVQKAALDVAQEQARIARLAYEEGTSTAMDLAEAEHALTEAHYQCIRAKADAFLARAALKLAVGN